jgi:hypothetical protein
MDDVVQHLRSLGSDFALAFKAHAPAVQGLLHSLRQSSTFCSGLHTQTEHTQC